MKRKGEFLQSKFECIVESKQGVEQHNKAAQDDDDYNDGCLREREKTCSNRIAEENVNQ